jgi:hypothetical protein
VVKRSRLGAAGACAVAAGALLATHACETASAQGQTARRYRSLDEPAAVEMLLAAVRGAGPVLCELAARSVEERFGWEGPHEVAPLRRDAQLRDVLRLASRRITDGRAVSLLRSAIADPDPCVRRVAAPLLGRAQHRDALPALLGALASPDSAVRAAAAAGLGYRRDRAASEALIAALRDPAASVRATGAWALGRAEDRTAVTHLTRLLEGDRDPAVRVAAAWALGKMN